MMQAVTPPSTTSPDWRALLAGSRTCTVEEAFTVPPSSPVLFLGAHPDDETFAAGATLASLARLGHPIHIASMTAGEAAWDRVEHTDRSLSVTRAGEFEAATAEIGATSSSIAGLPDSKLLACVNDVRAAIETLATDQDPAIMLTVWWCDPHPDHQAVGLAARHVGAARDIPVYGFPIWAQHWTHPRDVATAHQLICVLRHTDDDLDRRRRAEARYKSQTNQVRPDVEPVLPDSFLEWDIEFCLRSR